MHTIKRKSKHMQSKKNQGGFTFVELCIAVVVMLGAYLMISGVIIPKYQSWKAGIEATGASQATQSIKKQSASGSYGTGSLAVPLAAEIAGYYTNTGTTAAPVFQNRYGGTFSATGNNGTASAQDTLLPPVACVDVVVQIAKDWQDATVTAGSQTWAQGTSITATQAGAACTATSTTVSWTVNAGS